MKADKLFKLKELHTACTIPIASEAVKKFLPGCVEVETKKDERYWFKDNGGSILAVAHLDSVQKEDFCSLASTVYGTTIFSPKLDDRLGCYAIVNLLPKLLPGVPFDILLTENEEKGQSTAQHFVTNKQYQWMFMLDRGGEDCVCYQYTSKLTSSALDRMGWKHEYGMGSCIRKLEHLECKGFNFGVGYYEYHSLMAFAPLKVFLDQVDRVADFIRAYQLTSFPHKKETIWCGFGNRGGNFNDSKKSFGDRWPVLIENTVTKWGVYVGTQGEKFLFVGPNGKTMYYEAGTKKFKKACRESGLTKQIEDFLSIGGPVGEPIAEQCPRCHGQDIQDMLDGTTFCYTCQSHYGILVL